MTFLEAKQALARKLDINYSDIANNDVFSDTDLGEYINTACYMAWDFAFWDFAEHSKTATLLSGDITHGYVAYPDDIQPSSVYYLAINGQEYSKKIFNGYKRYFQNNPTAQDKFWAEFKRLIFFNTNIAQVGQVIDVYGKRNFQKLSADADVMPFSPNVDAQEFSGNDGVVILAYSLALSSEKKMNPTQGAVEEKRAYGIFTVLKNQLEAGRAIEQPKDTPMFDTPDYYRNKGRGRSSSPIGGFSV